MSSNICLHHILLWFIPDSKAYSSNSSSKRNFYVQFTENHTNKKMHAVKQLLVVQLQNYLFDSRVLLIHARASDEPCCLQWGKMLVPWQEHLSSLYFLLFPPPTSVFVEIHVFME